MVANISIFLVVACVVLIYASWKVDSVGEGHDNDELSVKLLLWGAAAGMLGAAGLVLTVAAWVVGLVA